MVALDSATAKALEGFDAQRLRAHLDRRRAMDRSALWLIGVFVGLWTSFAVIAWAAEWYSLDRLGSVLLGLWLGPVLWIVFCFMRRRRMACVAERGTLNLLGAAARVEGNAQSERTILKACFVLGMTGACVGLVSFLVEGRLVLAATQLSLLCMMGLAARRNWGKDFGQVALEWSIARRTRRAGQGRGDA